MTTAIDTNLWKAPVKYHDPQAVLDYLLNWADFFQELNAGDTIAASTWTVHDKTWKTVTDKLAVDNPAPSHSTTTTTVWVAVTGGLPGENYFVTNHIVTAQGRQDDRSVLIKLKEQ